MAPSLRIARFLILVVAALAIGTASDVNAAEARADRQAWAATAPVTTFQPQSGALYVSVVAGREESRSFVHVQLPDSSVRPGSLVLYEAGDTLMPTDAAIAACALTQPIPGDGRLATAPEADCSVRAVGSRDQQGTWSVNLDVFARRWATGDNFGLVLFPDSPAPAATWRLAFDSEKTSVEGTTQTEPPVATSTDLPDSSSTAAPTLTAAPTFSPPANLDIPVLESEPGADATLAAPGSSPDSRVPLASIGGESTVMSSVTAMGLLVLAGLVLTGLITRGHGPTGAALGTTWSGAGAILPTALIGGLVLLPLLFREVIVYKFGVVLIFFVAAIGLHILVNWAGQLSLAHAVTVAVPAFTVLTLSEQHAISPIYLLPIAVVVGAMTGALIALPTLRATGLQVALVTLVAGIGLSRFLLTQEWLVGGASGRAAVTPYFGPFRFATSRSLYPVLVLVVAMAVGVTWLLMKSKLARAWSWVRADPAAAASFGIPVVTYRIAAYAVGGAFGGLAGGLTAVWVQNLAPSAFPATLSFNYLLVVVLAGGGYLGGIAAAAFILQGGQQFATNIFGVDAGKWADTIITYGGPIGLIHMLGASQSGLNGLGRDLMERIRGLIGSEIDHEHRSRPTSWALAAGTMAIAAGFLAIALAWSHASGTQNLSVQNQEILSGGIGGLGLILVGVALLIRDRLARNQAALSAQLAVLVEGRSLPQTSVPRAGATLAAEEVVATPPAARIPLEAPSNGRRRRAPAVD